MGRGGSRSVKRRMRALLAELDYDFSQFTLEGFARWLEGRRGRGIVFVPYRMETPGLSGAWLADDDCDYVFYERDTAAVHQCHIQLHEMSHMICGHRTARVDHEQMEALFSRMDDYPESCSFVLLRSAQSDEHELEAEVLASLIQEQVLQNASVEELSRVISSEGQFEAYFAAYVEKMEGYRS